MQKIEFLEKHCTTSKDGVIALSNTFVETAIKIYNCPIKVTCSDYPEEESLYSVEDLLRPLGNPGPYPDKSKEGAFYSLYLYPWKGVSIKEKNSVVKNQNSKLLEKIDKESVYTITKMTLVPVPTKIPTTLNGYIGHIIATQRENLKLSEKDVVSKIREIEPTFSINTYRSIEKGEKNTNSKLNTYIAIAKALDLHISELFPPKN